MVRNYQNSDSLKLATIFANSILAIDDSMYSESQKLAWIGNSSNEFWQNRFAESLPLVAEIDGQVVGFIEFKFDKEVGEIDCFYIQSNYQGKGVGQALFDKVLEVAKLNDIKEIRVFASHIAKPFFAKQGFKVIRENSVVRSNVTLENWLMVKQ